MNAQSLLNIAQADPGLSPSEKAHLTSILQDKDIAKFLSGAAGATLLVVAGKYMKLGKTAQFLLGLAGFGVGRLIYDHVVNKAPQQQDHRQFGRYNDKLNMYEMDHNRY